MAGPSRDKREKRIASLMEMGVTRAAAKAALRAKSWQTDEVGPELGHLAAFTILEIPDMGII